MKNIETENPVKKQVCTKPASLALIPHSRVNVGSAAAYVMYKEIETESTQAERDEPRPLTSLVKCGSSLTHWRAIRC